MVLQRWRVSGEQVLSHQGLAVVKRLQRFVLDPVVIDCAGPRLSDVSSMLVVSKGVSICAVSV